jgi:hypothetical protein
VKDTAQEPWDGIRWEYKHVLLQPPVTGYRDRLGEEGWELVSAYPPDGKKEGLWRVFKRPKRPAEG